MKGESLSFWRDGFRLSDRTSLPPWPLASPPSPWRSSMRDPKEHTSPRKKTLKGTLTVCNAQSDFWQHVRLGMSGQDSCQVQMNGHICTCICNYDLLPNSADSSFVNRTTISTYRTELVVCLPKTSYSWYAPAKWLRICTYTHKLFLLFNSASIPFQAYPETATSTTLSPCSVQR